MQVSVRKNFFDVSKLTVAIRGSQVCESILAYIIIIIRIYMYMYILTNRVFHSAI